MSSLRLWQFCTAAPHISRQNAFLYGDGSRESINDVDEEKDYWYGTLGEVTYQQPNGFAHKTVWGVIKGCGYNRTPSESATPFALHTFTFAYKGDRGRISKALNWLSEWQRRAVKKPLTLKAVAESGAKWQEFRGVFIVSTHKELVENIEAHQGSWR